MTRLQITLALVVLCFAQNAAAEPKIVVTIAPVHSLVSAVLRDIGQAELLFSAARSPHGAGLKPSQVRALANADLVIRVDPEFERSVEKVVTQKPDADLAKRILTLSEIEGIQVFAGRDIDLQNRHEESGHQEQSDLNHRSHPDEGELDPHLWLSTHNASAITTAVVNRLSLIDPENAAAFQRNAIDLQKQIAVTRNAMQSRLSDLGSRWLFFHDAYQYLEREFDLTPVSTVTIDPDKQVSGKRLSKLVNLVERGALDCIYIEPQLRSDLIDRLVRGTHIKVLVLDPLGSTLKPGDTLWLDLMKNITKQLTACS